VKSRIPAQRITALSRCASTDAGSCASALSASAVLQWNSAALEAIRRSTLGPPAVARALAIVHTCIYDAWAG
jgi:hypothetical protein